MWVNSFPFKFTDSLKSILRSPKDSPPKAETKAISQVTSPVTVSRRTLRGGGSLGDRWGPHDRIRASMRRDTRELGVALGLCLLLLLLLLLLAYLSVIFSVFLSLSISFPLLMSIKKTKWGFVGDYKHMFLDGWSLMVETDLWPEHFFICRCSFWPLSKHQTLGDCWSHIHSTNLLWMASVCRLSSTCEQRRQKSLLGAVVILVEASRQSTR